MLDQPRAPAAREQNEKVTPETRAAKNSVTVTMRQLWPYIWPSSRLDLKVRVFGALALLLIAKIITVVVPYGYKWAADALTGKAGSDHIPLPAILVTPVALTIVYGLLRALMALFTQARDALFAAVAMNAVRRLAYDVFVHMHNLSLRFHLERKTGGLTRILERGRAAIETMVRQMMLVLFPTLVEFALIIGVFFVSFDWRYVLAISIMLAVYMTFTAKASNWRMSLRRTMNDSDTDATTKAVDSLLNFETVKYFGADRREAERYDKAMGRYERASVRTYTSLAVLNLGQAAIFTAGLVSVMVMCVLGIHAGTNTIGDFVLLNAMMIQLYVPLNFMGMVYREFKQALIDIEAMFDILGREAEIRDLPDAPPLKVTSGHVHFDDVRFSYDAPRPILKGISFEVPAGKTVAIVGPSGAGKSTISRLMFRFYEPQSGTISIDGQDISSVTQASLRNAIGMVPQDTVLFNDTIAYNIRYGRWDATEAEVREAARMAQIEGFIQLVPGGYDAQVGERGLKLSGGEKQRVAIARTILKGPPILVLDEATSALDSFTESEIQTALDRVSRGRTTLVIAHRLSTVVNADEILVLDKGVIVERGTHEMLLAKGGTYAGLWNRQREVDAARALLRDAGEEEPPKQQETIAQATMEATSKVDWRTNVPRDASLP